MSKKKSQRTQPTIADVQDLDPSQIVEGDELPIKLEWLPEFNDPRVGIFDALAKIPESGWENLAIYLYRLDPAVANKAGEKKYIQVYGAPITEEMVKSQHGGGKFEIYVKMGEHTLRRHRFAIEGSPIFQDGQTARGGPTAGQPVILPPQTTEQQLLPLVRAVIEATGGNKQAESAGIDIMKRAMTDGLDITKTIMANQIASTTGNGLGDKVVEMLLPRLLEPHAPDPMVKMLFEAFIAEKKADRKEANPAPNVQPTDQLALVKDIFGVDSLRDLIEIGSGKSQQTPWWVTLGMNAIEKLPTLLQEFAQMQERAFQRAVIAHQIGAAQPGQPAPAIMPTPNLNPPRQITYPAQQTPAPAIQSPEAMSQQMIAGIVDGICKAFEEGYPGDMAAVHVKLMYPELVNSLRPLLSNPQQLESFVKATPPLAELSTDPDWPDFQQDFIEEMRQQQQPAAIPQPVAEIQRGVTQDSVSRETLPPAKAPKPARAPVPKKANGSV